MSHGDLNHNGIVDGTDIALVSARSDDAANRPTTQTIVISPPVANISSPVRVMHQPIIFEQ